MTHSARQEVWLALSDLFLDTDVSLQRDHILRTLMASPFDLAKLEEIFISEVYPACIGNLHQVAGEWAGFDEAWLFERIAQQKVRQGLGGRVQRRLRWRWARRMVPEWFEIREALVAGGKR